MSRSFLGQNFLIDEDVQKRIVDLFQPPADFGEIGPGEGAITKLLSQKFSDFCVFEKDPRLAELHRSGSKNYRVREGDFADWNFELQHAPVKNYSLIGNLPYEASSSILKAVVNHADQIVHFLFMLQKEVVERISAKSKTSDFGSLSVFVQGQYDLEALDVIGPEAFDPPPRVQSQLVRGSRKKTGVHPLSKDYSKFVQSAFASKRKTLKNNWKGHFPAGRLEEVMKRLTLGEKVRAEEIDIDIWPQLFQFLRGE